MSVGKNIRIIAFDKNISQRELAAAGISEGIIWHIIAVGAYHHASACISPAA